MTRIDTSTLALPIEGLRLTGRTLGEQIAAAPDRKRTLLCFLRHFGCIFCREMVRDIKWASDHDPAYPAVLLIGQGSIDETHHFIDTTWADVPMVCDPDRVLYKAMHLGQGSVYQMFGPSVWACGVRASLKGNFVGKFIGDPWTMPGAFLVESSGAILWQHEFRHQGDHPNWATIARYAHAATPTIGAESVAVI